MYRSKIYEVGKARVTKVLDCELDGFTPTALLPDWEETMRPLLAGMPDTTTVDGANLRLSIHSWIVWHHGRTIIVDTGVGNDKPRPFAPYFDHLRTGYLDRLKDAGVSLEQVDYVLHTHLHVDHVGWNTRLIDGRWVPTFPNARHIFSAKEFAFFGDTANRDNRHRTSFQTHADSVAPIVEAGMADMIVVDGSEVLPGFSFHSTPGHSVDHASIVLESAGARALFAGDVVHHPIQIRETQLLSVFDPERETTLRSRRWALDFAVDNEALLFSSHFPATSAGRVDWNGKRYDWSFL